MSTYRTAPRVAEPVTVAMLCAGCGARAEERFGDRSYRCGACGLEQPVVRDDVLATSADLEVKACVPGYAELEPFARTLGLERGAMGLTLMLDGVELEVSLDTSSGVVKGLVLAVSTAGLPPMSLRYETEDDRIAKADRVASEVQTGDEAFDRAVFIESHAADADVLVPLASPTVRAAFLHLLRHASPLAVTPAGVKIVEAAGKPAFNATRITRALVALRVVAGAPRSVSPARPSQRRRIFAFVVAALTVPAFALELTASHFYPTVSFVPMVIGAAIGVVGGLASWPILGRILRGRSTSVAEIRIARGGSVFTGAFVATAALVTANGALDTAPPRRHELVALSVEKDDENEDVTRVTARGPEPGDGKHSYGFEDPEHRIALPAVVRVTWGDGALGFRWDAGPTICHTEDHPTR